MNIWILTSVVILIIISALIFKYRNHFTIKSRNIFLIVIIITLIITFSWIQSLMVLFPSLPIIDLSAGLILSAIIGFFIAAYLVNKY